MITVHHLNNSRSHRVLWLLEELGLDYDIVRYQRNPKTMFAPRELREIHPLGKSPVVTDDGATVAESGAIIEYLLERYGEGRLIPEEGTPERLRFLYWLHYAEGSAMTPLLLKLVFSQLPVQAPLLARPLLKVVSKTVGRQYIDPQIRLHMGFWEDELAEREYFAGDEFTAVDIQMSFPVEAALSRGADPSRYPRLSDFEGRIQARPAYQRAVERGGPYQI